MRSTATLSVALSCLGAIVMMGQTPAPAPAAQAPHVRAVVIGDPVAERAAAVAGRQALGGREQVLDGDGHAAERSRIAGADAVGLCQSSLAADVGEGIQPGIETLDPRQGGADELARRKLARAHHLRLFDGTQPEDVVVVHSAQSLRAQ